MDRLLRLNGKQPLSLALPSFYERSTIPFLFQPAFIGCLLVLVFFLTMVTETDSKPVNEFDYVEGAKPVYRKKVQDASRSLDQALKREPWECCCGKCYSWCRCCCRPKA